MAICHSRDVLSIFIGGFASYALGFVLTNRVCTLGASIMVAYSVRLSVRQTFGKTDFGWDSQRCCLWMRPSVRITHRGSKASSCQPLKIRKFDNDHIARRLRFGARLAAYLFLLRRIFWHRLHEFRINCWACSGQSTREALSPEFLRVYSSQNLRMP